MKPHPGAMINQIYCQASDADSKTNQNKTNRMNILRQNEAVQSTGSEPDPLSGAAASWEAPSFPVLAADRLCLFKITSCKRGATKADASRESLTVILSTEKDYPDSKGKTLKSGFKVYKRIGLTPSEGKDDKRPRTWEDIGKDLAHLLKCAGNTTASPRDLYNNPSMLEGLLINGTTGIEKATGSFGESNSVMFKLPA